jgi:hypothetical protein
MEQIDSTESLISFGARSVVENLLSLEGKLARAWVLSSTPFRNYAQLSHLNVLCGWFWHICGVGKIAPQFFEEISESDRARMDHGLDEMWRDPNGYSNNFLFVSIMHVLAIKTFSCPNEG